MHQAIIQKTTTYSDVVLIHAQQHKYTLEPGDESNDNKKCR